MLTLPTPEPSHSRHWYQSLDDLRSVGTISTRWLGRAESHATVRAPADSRWQEAEMDLRPSVDCMAASYLMCGRDILELGRSTFGTDEGERPIAKTKPGSARGTLSKSHQQPMIGIGSPMQGP
jgi:hypothetical protein